METGKYINSNRSKKIHSSFKGERTFNESSYIASAKPEDNLVINFPCEDNTLLVPESLALSFNFIITGDDDAYPFNNLSSNLFSSVVIKVGSTIIFSLSNANLFYTYKDLWLTEEQRKNSVFRGIQDEELRKMRSNPKYKPENPKKSYEVLKNIYGNRYILPLNFEVFADHIPLPTYDLKDEISIELKLNSVKNVIKTTKLDGVSYKLESIKRCFETIKYDDLYSDIIRKIDSGFSFLFDHIFHLDVNEIEKTKTLINKEISIDRNSLKGILFLFQNEEKDDSESFPNPQITSVDIVIGGISNKIYNSCYSTPLQWHEISRYFLHEDHKVNNNSFMDIEKYYSEDKYGLWIDFRTTEDGGLYGSGRKIESKQVKVIINRKNTGAGKYMMHTYIVADARVIIENRKFKPLELEPKKEKK